MTLITRSKADTFVYRKFSLAISNRELELTLRWASVILKHDEACGVSVHPNNIK